MTDTLTGEQVDVAVLGAGIVGVSAAYAARQRGLSVVVVDRREPGSETSYGNAGILSSGSILPLNQPSLWSALPKYLTNRHAALALGYRLGDAQSRLGRALSRQRGGLAHAAARARAARPDRRLAEAASRLDRAGRCGRSASARPAG